MNYRGLSRIPAFCTALGLTLLSMLGVAYSRGIVFWLSAAGMLIGVLWTPCFAFDLTTRGKDLSSRLLPLWTNVTLLTVSLCASLVIFEAYLAYVEWSPSSIAVLKQVASPTQEEPMPAVKLPAEVVAHAAWRKSLLSLPSEYQRHNVVVQGANRAYNWHGVVHVHDENGMRRSSPFQEKRADIFRVMVVGDSLTYGDGVDEKWTYPSVLQRLLAPDYRVEFLNLGVDGYQSEDVLRTIRQFTPKLKPNLIIYGVCLNDFLPSGVEQYGADQYAFPLPIAMKKLLTERTRVGKFLDKSYDALLIRVGARADFVDDILRDFGNYQKRFMRDVSNMNKFALANGIPPLVSMVLDQSPQFGGRGHKIAKIAEKYLKAARIDVIDTEPYYRQYDGEELHVSRWEGHPNEQAHAIFAEMFKHRLLERGYLAPYRR